MNLASRIGHIVLVMTLVGCGPAGMEQRNAKMNPKMSYFSNNGDEALPTELKIDAEGQCTLLVRTNRANPQYANAGVFSMKMRERRLRPLAQAMSTPDFEAIAKPEGVQSGDVVRKLSITPDGGQEMTRYAVEGKKTPPAFVDGEQEALKIAAEVRKKPEYAIALDEVKIPERINRGEKTRMSFVLRNPGPNPVQIPHPKLWAEKATQVQLVALRSDVPIADLRSHHQVFETLGAADMKATDGAGSSEEVITIAAGKSVTIAVEKLVEWTVGRYDVRLTFETALADEKGEEVIRCEIVSKPYPAACLGAAQPTAK